MEPFLCSRDQFQPNHIKTKLYKTGCQVCLHIASPYTLTVKNPQLELVDPAVKGTLSVLKSASLAQVKIVILTSSIAAITDAPKKGYLFTEEDWNSTSSLRRNPYMFSKVCAEKAAWDYHKSLEGNSKFELISLLPGFVLGEFEI